jgi:ABC-type antimicrobial peptide transport system permease subunit
MAMALAVAAIDPSVPVAHLTTQEQVIGGTISQERLVATSCAALAVFALALSCFGLYGLLSFNVARRTREIGIRMAVGARPSDVARTIFREALVFIALGMGLGLPAVPGLTRIIESQLYGVRPADPATLLAVMAALILAALSAAWVPARSASRTNPMEALRTD